MKVLKLIICFLVFGSSFSQTNTYDTGKIINSIEVTGTEGETFALYLPKDYNKKEASAIVFIFDPSGHGVKGLKPFVSSAERFNYMLVCSNNSKNGPYQSNFDIANRLFTHVFSAFRIDQKQIYTAGFSGGSRLATTIAVLTGSIQGVIGCGAGFAQDFNYMPSAQSTFSYVGLVGDEDMNYREMFEVKAWLDRFKVDTSIFTYEDGHRWPPEAQIERAFIWLELQAYKRNLRKKDTAQVITYYKENYSIADSLSIEHPFRAVMEYDRLIENYDAYVNLDSIHDKRRFLQKSKTYKHDLKAREDISAKEEKLAVKFLSKFNQESALGESRDNFAWWERELKKLDDDLLKDDDYYMNKMGKRLRYRIFAVAYESAMVNSNTKRMDKVLYCYKLLTKLAPDRPYWYFILAETYAKTNDAKNARINLKMAVDKGFKDVSKITSNPLFIKFEKDIKFAEFLSSLID